jgi:hypothetical protein
MDGIMENNDKNGNSTGPLFVQCWACHERNIVPRWQGVALPLMQVRSFIAYYPAKTFVFEIQTPKQRYI